MRPLTTEEEGINKEDDEVGLEKKHNWTNKG